MKVHGRELTADEISEEMKQHGRVRTGAEMALERSKLEMRRVGQMLLTAEDGKLLLTMLEEAYYRGNMIGDDPQKTYFKLGQRDVVVFLLGLRDQAKEK